MFCSNLGEYYLKWSAGDISKCNRRGNEPTLPKKLKKKNPSKKQTKWMKEIVRLSPSLLFSQSSILNLFSNNEMFSRKPISICQTLFCFVSTLATKEEKLRLKQFSPYKVI